MKKASEVINILNEQKEISSEEDSFEMGNIEELLNALKRIVEHEYRADRRKKGMVDISELKDLQRIARKAIEKFYSGKKHEQS